MNGDFKDRGIQQILLKAPCIYSVTNEYIKYLHRSAKNTSGLKIKGSKHKILFWSRNELSSPERASLKQRLIFFLFTLGVTYLPELKGELHRLQKKIKNNKYSQKEKKFEFFFFFALQL